VAAKRTSGHILMDFDMTQSNGKKDGDITPGQFLCAHDTLIDSTMCLPRKAHLLSSPCIYTRISKTQVGVRPKQQF